jgi:hypothetical protein
MLIRPFELFGEGTLRKYSTLVSRHLFSSKGRLCAANMICPPPQAWSMQLKTSVYGAAGWIVYDSAANNAICTLESQFNTAGSLGGPQPGVGAGLQIGGNYPGFTNCNNNWKYWVLGSRTQWNITPAMYVGLDVLYTKLVTASSGFVYYTALAGNAKPTGYYQLTDQDQWIAQVRFHRDILP